MSEGNWRIRWGHLVAEFVVIVVGVLVALAADAWWGRLNEAEERRTHLTALRTDAIAASEAIESAIGEEEARMRIIARLLDVPDTSVAQIDSIDAWLRVGLWGLSSHELSFDAYSDLINAGQLELISDEEVRRLLTVIQRRLGRFVRDQETAAQAQIGYIDPLAVREFDVARIVPVEGGPSSADTNPEHQALLGTRHVRNLLVAKAGFTRGGRVRLQRLRDQFDQLVSAIDRVLAS